MAIKITDLNDGGTPLSTDEIPVARGLTTVKVRLTELNNAKIIANIPSGTFTELVSARIGLNDAFRVRAGSSTDNAGEVELATSDDGTEQIHVRQYTGNFAAVSRTLTLLDGSGYTKIPTRLYVNASTGTSTMNVDGSISFTGNASTPILNITQSGAGLSLQAAKIGLNTTNPLNALTVIGSISASSNILTESVPTIDSHVTNKKFVDTSISNLNISTYAKLANTQTFTNTNTFSEAVNFNKTSNFILSASSTAYSISAIPVFINDPSSTARQMYYRTPTDVRGIIGAEPTITTLPVSKGGTGTGTHTVGQVLVGNGIGAITTVSRDGIDTRLEFPTRKEVFEVGNNLTTTFTAIHNFNTRDVTVSIFETTFPYTTYNNAVIRRELLNYVAIIFPTPPTVAQYRVVIIG